MKAASEVFYGVTGLGKAWYGPARLGAARQAWLGEDRPGRARTGEEWQGTSDTQRILRSAL